MAQARLGGMWARAGQEERGKKGGGGWIGADRVSELVDEKANGHLDGVLSTINVVAEEEHGVWREADAACWVEALQCSIPPHERAREDRKLNRRGGGGGGKSGSGCITAQPCL